MKTVEEIRALAKAYDMSPHAMRWEHIDALDTVYSDIQTALGYLGSQMDDDGIWQFAPAGRCNAHWRVAGEVEDFKRYIEQALTALNSALEICSSESCEYLEADEALDDDE